MSRPGALEKPAARPRRMALLLIINILNRGMTAGALIWISPLNTPAA
jgi:hypothetical protein